MDKTILISLPIEDLQTVIIDCVNVCLKTNKDKQITQSESDNPLSIKDVAALTGLKVATLYGYCQRREIPYHKTGNRLRFFKPQIISWIKKGRIKTVSEIEEEAEEYLSNKKSAAL